MTTPTAPTITSSMIDAAKKRAMKIPAKLITIDRAEGPADRLGITTHETWESAETRIRNICWSMDKTKPGYDKCDFRIEYVDGETYAGRYDAQHPDRPNHEGTLERHIREHLTFLAGLWKPNHLTQQQYEGFLTQQETTNPGCKQSALDFLTKYALNDDESNPTLKPKDPPMQTAAQTAATAPTSTPSGLATTVSPPPPQKSAREAHEENVEIGKASGKPWQVVVGNTFPIRGVLYAFGGTWDGKAKQWSVPSHKHAEAQAAADRFTKPAKQPQAIATSAPTPSVPVRQPQPVSTPTPLPPTAKPINASASPMPTPKPAAKKPGKAATMSPLQKRLQALLTGAEHIRVDLKAANGDADGELHFALEHIRRALEKLG